MKRREFISLLGGAAAWPLAAKAQQAGKVQRIGFLWENANTFPDALEAFRQELRRLGYIEGTNLIIEFRWAEGDPGRMRELAEDLVRLPVDVIVAPSSVYTAAAKQATSTIPIVFMSHADPLRTGHVASLAHPGGNVTGFSLMMTETNVKGLELLKETLPDLARVAVLYEPATPSHGPGLQAAKEAGPTLGLRVQPVAAPSAAEFENAFSAMGKERAQAVLVLSTPLFIAEAKPLAELGLKYKLASLYGPKQHVTAGGLMSYSPDRADLWRRGAGYVDKVLKDTNIKGRVLVLHGADDPLVPKAAVDALEKQLTDAKVDWQVVLYSGTVHSFTNPASNDPAHGVLYNERSDGRSWIAMQDFLREVFAK